MRKANNMKVLVCGGRWYGWTVDFNTKKVIRNIEEYDKFNDTMNELLSQDLRLISGHASGADSLAEEWAFRHSIPIYVFPARWTGTDKLAGFKRNQQMLDEGKPDVVLAFPGGKGTADMITRARKANIEVIEVE